MKRFTVPCSFGAEKAPFHLYIGAGPAPGCHPLKYQEHWLETVRGGTFPPEVVESFVKLFAIAEENGVSFEELCVYALGTAATVEPNQSPITAEPEPQ